MGPLQSTSGTAFDGTAFASTAVYFPVSASAAFAGTTLSVPSGVHTMLVTGLAVNTSYGVSIQPNAVTISANGSSATTDAGGVLKVTF